MTRVLFVCLGNICRSPTAHGALRDLIRERGLRGRVEVDSCGTSAWHNGEGADANMIRAARTRGLDLSDQVSRKILESDLYEYDLVVCMDRSNESDVRDLALPNATAEIRRFCEFVSDSVFAGPDVPDPYYGGPEGFLRVVDIVLAGVPGVLDRALELAAKR